MIELAVEGRQRLLDPEVVVIAGFTGRDERAVRAHVEELAREGVPAPPRTPMYYLAPAGLLTQDDRVAVVSPATSGEVELVLFVDGDEAFVGLGSDHTDRAAERHDIALAKLACRKPVSRSAWPFEAVRDDWDSIRLRSWASIGSGAEAYQDSEAGVNLPPAGLLESVPWRRKPRCFALFTGTVATLGGVRPARRFAASADDPSGRPALRLHYDVVVLDDLMS
ncbi:MAG: DUF2848 family protein [Acidimicrobiales bacterium]